MSIPTAINQLIEIESMRQTGILQRLVCGTLAELAVVPEERFGEPLHSLVIVGKRLHPLEVDFAGEWAVDESSWREVARTHYGCGIKLTQA
jgi:diphthine synthase